MTSQDDIQGVIDGVTAGLHDKLGVGGADLRRTLARARHRLPRRIRAQARLLARAEPLAAHPRLRQTLDAAALQAAATQVTAYLQTIDPGERRKGWWLGLLGGLAFNLLLLGVLLLVLARWRGMV